MNFNSLAELKAHLKEEVKKELILTGKIEIEKNEKEKDEEIKEQSKKLIKSRSYVYFIKDTRNGFIKIGKSTKPYSRLSSLSSGNPNKLELIGLIYGGLNVEKKIHKSLKSFKVRNEWFKPTNFVIDYITKLISNDGIFNAVEVRN